jgi:sulfite reductase alpha subunit-like flavoprotein
MASQIHRRFTDDQVKLLLELYNKKAIPLEQVLRQLECSRSRFYQILKAYHRDPGEFTVAYSRDYPQHRLSKKMEGGRSVKS